jgi:hypothetical protein
LKDEGGRALSDAQLDLREQIARIDRAIEETHKFTAESRKLEAEARKLDRDRRLAPWQVAVVTMGGIAALVGGLLTIVKALHP